MIKCRLMLQHSSHRSFILGHKCCVYLSVPMCRIPPLPHTNYIKLCQSWLAVQLLCFQNLTEYLILSLSFWNKRQFSPTCFPLSWDAALNKKGRFKDSVFIAVMFFPRKEKELPCIALTHHRQTQVREHADAHAVYNIIHVTKALSESCFCLRVRVEQSEGERDESMICGQVKLWWWNPHCEIVIVRLFCSLWSSYPLIITT